MNIDVTAEFKENKIILELYTNDILPLHSLVNMIEHEIGNIYWHIEDLKHAKKRLKALRTLLDYHGNDYSENTVFTEVMSKTQTEIKRVQQQIKEKKKEGDL